MATKKAVKKVDKVVLKEKGHLKTTDGMLIHYRIYGPRKPTHYLLVANGRSEWTAKYEDLHERLGIKKQCALIMWDHRGQGESDGEAFHIDSYSTFVSDTYEIAKTCIPKGFSYGIIAHSMGGLIALLATLRRKLSPEFLILSSPLLRLPDKPLNHTLARTLAWSFHKVGLGRLPTGVSRNKTVFHNNTLTHSYRNFQSLDKTPRPFQSPTFSWVSATFDATEEVFQSSHLNEFRTPTLIIGGSKESVVDYRGFSHWTQKANELSSCTVSFHLVPGGRHELLNETDKFLAQVRQAIQRWDDRQLIRSYFEI